MFAHILALPFILIACGKNFNTWFEGKIQRFSRFCMNVLRVDLEIKDQAILAKVDWSRPVFVMGNHNSYSDIPVVFLSIERTIGFIAKRELQHIPFLNFWMHRIGCVFVNREKGGGARLIREAMARGRSPRLCMFPEGTRGKDDSLSPFKSGGFRLSIETDATILPVVIKGTRAAWEKRVSLKPVKVSVKILEPLDIKTLKEQRGELEPRKDVMKLVRESMEKALA
jgi:1-acyl-sn-glycerol-3-phosphate acyltransferase